jgi:hypothetical protein
MSAAGSSSTPRSGFIGMPLPHRNGLREGATIRGRTGFPIGSMPTNCCQRLPVAASTSTMP